MLRPDRIRERNTPLSFPSQTKMDKEEAREEQEQELEALEAIFADEFRLLDAACGTSGARFEVDLTEAGGASVVKLRLVFTHALLYPDEALHVVAHVLEGLGGPLRKRLQVRLEAVCGDNLGGVAVYTVCEAAREWVLERVGVEEEEEEEEGRFETFDGSRKEKVEVIGSKAVGTSVTVEGFAEWRAGFEKEMEGLKSAEERAKELGGGKLTGREMFERKVVVVSAESEAFWEAEAGV